VTADDLLRDAEAKFDRAIVQLALAEGNRLLAAGATADDLPQLMQPFVAAVRQWRVMLWRGCASTPGVSSWSRR
jgi:hypothetical protein